MRGFKSLIFLSFLFPQFGSSQVPHRDSLDWFINKEMADYRIPGLAIGIIKNNELVLKKGYGVTSMTNGMAVTTQTVFPIMSCTKAFTAVALGILVDQKKVKWDDKVIKYLPDFRLSDPSTTKNITISDILSHQSGLESYEGDLLWYGTNYSRNEIIKRIRFSPLKNKLRKTYGYQNIMYLVAGMIVEKVSGKSWDRFIEENIFHPLKMDHSSTSIYNIKGDAFALPHLTNLPMKPVSLDNIAPAGAINSTIEDMLLWVKVWTEKGNQIISSESVNNIIRPRITLQGQTNESYGFGWQIETDSGSQVISHGGAMPGYKSMVTIDLKNKTAVIILTNKTTYFTDELSGIILSYLENSGNNWMETDQNLSTKNFRFGWEENNKIPFQMASEIPNFKNYSGSYTDKQYGTTIITTQGDTAIMRFLPSEKQFRGYLRYINKDTMSIVFSDPFINSGRIIFIRTGEKLTGFKFDIPPGDFIFNHFNFRKSLRP